MTQKLCIWLTALTMFCRPEPRWKVSKCQKEQGPLKIAFALRIAPQSGFRSSHLSILSFTTQVYSHNSPLKTLARSPLWHFQVFTVVTNIEGKQQTEHYPSQLPTGKQTQNIRAYLLSQLSYKKNSSYRTILSFLDCVLTIVNRSI